MEENKDGGKVVEPQMTNEIRKGWNDFTSWLAKKGLQGKPELDKNDYGFQVLEEYRKENPETPITRELIPAIQKEFSNYRDWSLKKIKEGKAGFAPGVTEDNYMKSLSIVDGYPGQFTTRHSFPETYLQTMEDGKVISKENQGFATTNK